MISNSRLALVVLAPLASAIGQPPPAGRGPAVNSQEAEALAEPFRGITTNGTVQPGLFKIRSTGVSTEPVLKAANAFLAVLTPEQRSKTTFPVDDPEWR